MSQLIVVIFEGADTAARVRQSIHSVQGSGYVNLDDSAIVSRDAEGKIHLKNEMDRGIKTGAVGGSLLGLLIGGLFFPVGGLVLGAIGGALVGKLAGVGLDNKFVKEVSDSLEPDSSAIFLLVRDDSNPDMVAAALRKYEGKVYQTTLSKEDEETLRRALRNRPKS